MSTSLALLPRCCFPCALPRDSIERIILLNCSIGSHLPENTPLDVDVVPSTQNSGEGVGEEIGMSN